MPSSDAHNSADRARRVREMFGAVARRYDLLNHLLSAGLDRRWRARAAAALAEALEGGVPIDRLAVAARGDGRGRMRPRPSARGVAPLVLDLCCGTGDLAMAVLARTPEAHLVAVDFSRPMLQRAASKLARAHLAPRAACLEADALALPLADGSADAVACGFGLRNLADPAAGLAEMMRVLRPGGAAAILEFHRPRGRGAWARAFHLYFRRILPRLGDWISGGGHGGYAYLAASIEAFGPPEATAEAMRRAGFAHVRAVGLRGGVAAVYVGLKPGPVEPRTTCTAPAASSTRPTSATRPATAAAGRTCPRQTCTSGWCSW
ncbi:MAG: ubiquinone/menaquinone biosynthesis methyltransferase [Planctomycetes bacterium]|nr:ubiquinone/menaquinone biosynthesis methyltransferase [Planctomycetota bacterium]